MADNYLEKRMDELRSGKLAIKKVIPGIKPKARRVLVAGGCQGVALEKALEFRKKGCRVAVFDSDKVIGKQMAHDHGIRFHHVDPKDEYAAKKEMNSLLNVWRGVDVIIGDYDNCQLLSNEVKKWKESLPIDDKSDIEIVIINEISQS